MKNSLALALAGALFAPAAWAFEVTGGSVGIGYSSFTGSSSDANKTTLDGSLEFGFDRQFSVQTDIGLSKFGFTEFDNRALGLHGIYHASETTSVGAFIGQDRIEGVNIDHYGLEVGHQMGQFSAEAYLSRADVEGIKGTVVGAKGDYAINPMASVGLRFDNINVSGGDASRVALTGAFAATEGLSFHGEVGNADIDGLGSETFVGVGVKVNFGAKRGATFDRRSVIDLIPGF